MKTVQDVLTYVDLIKPNAFDNATKTGWLSEVEGRIKTEVLVMDSFLPLVYSYIYKSAGISFSDAATMLCPTATQFRAGDEITVTGLASYANNNITSTVVSVSDDGKTLTFADGTFTDIGTDGDTGEASVTYDGSGVELSVSAPYDNLYGLYLMSMIDFANGEYNKYNNTVLAFNGAMDEYRCWYRRNNQPAVTTGYSTF